jgi:hypothetical protein
MHPAQNKTTTAAAAASCGSSISYNLVENFSRDLLQLLCKNANHGCAIAGSLYCLNQHRLSICPHFGRSNDSRRDSQPAWRGTREGEDEEDDDDEGDVNSVLGFDFWNGNNW